MAGNILVAEDDPSDAFFLQRAFSKVGKTVALQFVRDGQEVVDYLRGEGTFADRHLYPMPDLLLLDLKMPRMDGFEALTWIRKQPSLRRLPVLIFSGSEQLQDINKAYDLGANSYLVKPHATQELMGLVNRLWDYWLGSNRSAHVRSMSPRKRSVDE
jgi:CheY-like chemotaxis protein